MSISFIPTAGTWTGYSYYTAEPEDQLPFEDVQHGIRRSQDIEPSVDCHMSGAFWLLARLGLHHESCGEATSGEVPRLLKTANSDYHYYVQQGGGEDSYEARKLRSMIVLLQHCLYHNCGFTWA